MLDQCMSVLYTNATRPAKLDSVYMQRRSIDETISKASEPLHEPMASTCMAQSTLAQRRSYY